MTDREKAIKTLEDIIATAEGIKGLSEDAGIIIDLDKIESLRFALESIKVDRAYDLAYEKVDFIEIPEGATNGDMIKAMFLKAHITINKKWGINGTVFVCFDNYRVIIFDLKWWNSPYRKEQE